jgi:parallel beta-helix repeat protein
MRSWKRLRYGTGVMCAALATGMAGSIAGGLAPANAAAAWYTNYVSPHGSVHHSGRSCATARFRSIQAAVSDTAAGGTVIVCRGVYRQSVTITKPLVVQGLRGAVINARGRPYGIGLASPAVEVRGLWIENATINSKKDWPGDGIITAGFVRGKPVAGNQELIIGNRVQNNQGAGIDLNSTSHSLAENNVAEGNGVGINLSDDLGKPDAGNVVRGNTSSRNPGGCGVALAEHTGAGIYGNLVQGNVLDDNGLGTPSRPNASAGSGVILASATKSGGVFNNVIKGNRLAGNGHGGVAMHVHLKGPRFSGNLITGNTIGTNNRRTDAGDLRTTGIYLGSAGPSSITVVNNLIYDNRIGIFAAGPVAVAGVRHNTFRHVFRHFKRIAVYPA